MLKGQLDEIMVRRLKADIRELEGGFPRRTVVQVDIGGLPADASELVLAEKLDAYRREREKRLTTETRSRQAAGALVTGGLQKRLLSSIEAFAKTLAVHRRSVERAIETAQAAADVSGTRLADLERMIDDPDADTAASEMADDEGELYTDDSLPGAEERTDQSEIEHRERMESATAASSDASRAEAREALERELGLVDEMRDIAGSTRPVALLSLLEGCNTS